MKTILVVDDERDLLTAVAGVLEDEGYGVIECSDGREALERLATQKPDAALIDVASIVRDTCVASRVIETLRGDRPGHPCDRYHARRLWR